MKRTRAASGFRVVLIIMAAIIIYFGVEIHKQQKKISELEQNLESKQEEMVQINSEIADLENTIENSDSLQFVERIAREEYGMVKPKEVIFVDKENNAEKNDNK